MKYIKKYETKKNIENIKDNYFDIVESFSMDKNNFPELGNIKEISRDLDDWCFINTLPIKIFWGIFRINNIRGKEEPIPLIWDLDLKGFDENQIYYKSYVIDINKPMISNSNIITNKGEKYKGSLYENFEKQMDLIQKRLVNYGFSVLRDIDSATRAVLYIIDKNDLITFKEIIDKHEASK